MLCVGIVQIRCHVRHEYIYQLHVLHSLHIMKHCRAHSIVQSIAVLYKPQ